MHYFDLHIGDYDKATAHLSACEDGIYGRLMRRYYDTETPLTADMKALQRFVRARTKEELAAVEIVLAEFFTLEPDGWHHKRCDIEIRRYREKSQKARESVSKRWAKRDADTVREACETPTEPIREAYERNTEALLPARVPQEPITTLVSKIQRARGSRLPNDWHPGDSGMAFASSLGLVNGKALAELAKFRDHWAAKTGQDAAKADWQAAWRNWLRRSVEFGPQKAQASSAEELFAGAK